MTAAQWLRMESLKRMAQREEKVGWPIARQEELARCTAWTVWPKK